MYSLPQERKYIIVVSGVRRGNPADHPFPVTPPKANHPHPCLNSGPQYESRRFPVISSQHLQLLTLLVQLRTPPGRFQPPTLTPEYPHCVWCATRP